MSSTTPTMSEELLPPYLPPRRPKSLPNLPRNRSSWTVSAAGANQPTPAANQTAPRPRRKLTKRRQYPDHDPTGASPARATDELTSRPTSYQSFSSGDTATAEGSQARPSADRPPHPDAPPHSPTRSIPSPNPSSAGLKTQFAAPTAVRLAPPRPAVLRNSSLRVETRLSDEELTIPPPPTAATVLGTSHSDPALHRRGAPVRPHSHPASGKSTARAAPFSPGGEEAWPLGSASRPPSRRPTPSATPQREGPPKPRASFKRLASLDNLLTFREERAGWRRASSLLPRAASEASVNEEEEEEGGEAGKVWRTPEGSARPSGEGDGRADDVEKRHSDARLPQLPSAAPSECGEEPAKRPVFRHPSTEYGFIFTVAVMQLLGEYLITGFAMELPSLLSGRLSSSSGGTMGLFWPAALLTLILSATLLTFARLSDMYGGYPCFMFGVLWLALWTLVPGFARSLMLLNVARAMQGLAIAAYMPSTFALIGTLYPEGPRRNVVLGFYSGCAPVGFFAGFLVAGALPTGKTSWYFWTASIAAFAMAAVAYVSIPTDRADRGEMQLHMDWIGAGLITAGLVLLAYALSVEPYTNQSGSGRSGFAFPTCYGPLTAGLVCLAVAFWYEGWQAKCPLLPFDFFAPKSVKPLALACLCFYASYGVWLYNSAEFFQSPSGVSKSAATGEAISGIQLALWYAPTAIGGILLCVFSGALLHIIPIMVLLLLSAVAWLAAPLLLALAPLPLNYWSFVLPSMLCATVGLDLTYTVSVIFLSSAQPLKYQGLSGAVASSLINLGMSFALPISEIAMKRAQESVAVPAGDEAAMDKATNWGFRAAFFYAAASAGMGLIICVLFVRISRGVVSQRPRDEERPRAAMSEATLVDDGDERAAPTVQQRCSSCFRDAA